MNALSNEYVKQAITAVICTVVGLALGNWNDSWFDVSARAHDAASSAEVRSLEQKIGEIPTKAWMRSQFASKEDVKTWQYRVGRLEKDFDTFDRRQRRNTGILYQLCQIHKGSIVCSNENAIWRSPTGREDGDHLAFDPGIFSLQLPTLKMASAELLGV